MRKEYDFSKMQGTRNPYYKKLKKQITIRLDQDIIEYFKKISEEFDVKYQNLINLYLKECAREQKKPEIKWLKAG